MTCKTKTFQDPMARVEMADKLHNIFLSKEVADTQGIETFQSRKV
jgi:hypothetical protein